MSNNIISWSEWEETYKPTTDTIIDFWSDVKFDSPYQVWTVVDNNPNSVYLDIIPGHRVFNRLGFFVTEKEWSNQDMVVSNDPSYA